MKSLWKTTCVIWTDYNPVQCELEDLARQATVGDAYCSKQLAEHIEDVDQDPDWDGNQFFADPERFE